MARTFNLNAQCHCGTISQPIRSPPIDDLAHDFRAQESSPKKVQLCHCTSCRRSTGNLYASYYLFSPPHLENTTAYPPIPINPDRPDKIYRRHFCSTCGCHIFRSIFDKQRVKYSDVKLKASECMRWGVATGTLDDVARNVEFSDHVFVGDTKDGGAAVWLRETYRGPLSVYAHAGRDYYTGKFPPRITFSKQKHRYPHLPLLGDDQLKASCLCKAVQFHITRPTSSLQIVSPNIPDFLKGEKEKEGRWWLRENGTKYLAGLCVCRTCRLTSGFEIQPWAYVPRANISFNSPSQHASTGEEATTSTPLNLEALSAGIFTTYETSLQ
ncbi:uncharacterized protein PAC_04655 [Phialocephala subalpina]|uniref:CENP-V/GFA domain-containing protein n=1 Tax=Phialocephala subalpina TaxID=576137 RepID=A0A1L7WPV3_9HELO|nr:uncharacterized protein PAC_04655 [Phialocephala subalpina]